MQASVIIFSKYNKHAFLTRMKKQINEKEIKINSAASLLISGIFTSNRSTYTVAKQPRAPYGCQLNSV
jgi:L-asparagine transporter-like permease